ncbi:MAG: hypothetical protein ACI8WT_003986 [Clostridium sp.]|jgi:hypothetical protein
MEYINYILNILIVIFYYIIIVLIIRVVANYIGEKLGIGKFLINLWRKIRKK